MRQHKAMSQPGNDKISLLYLYCHPLPTHTQHTHTWCTSSLNNANIVNVVMVTALSVSLDISLLQHNPDITRMWNSVGPPTANLHIVINLARHQFWLQQAKPYQEIAPYLTPKSSASSVVVSCPNTAILCTQVVKHVCLYLRRKIQQASNSEMHLIAMHISCALFRVLQ